MNGFFLKNDDNDRLDISIDVVKKVVIIELIVGNGTTCSLTINSKEDLEKLQDAVRNIGWELEELLNPRQRLPKAEELIKVESEVANG